MDKTTNIKGPFVVYKPLLSTLLSALANVSFVSVTAAAVSAFYLIHRAVQISTVTFPAVKY